jgi:predicted DNA-binding transcriptional regulator AlpA
MSISTETSNTADPFEALREPRVSQLVSLAPRTLQRRVAKGTFPAPRRLGTSRNAPKVWLRHEVLSWLASLPTGPTEGAAS